jgi:Thioredoxin
MMRLVLAAGLAAVAVMVAAVLRRRALADAPTQPRGVLPSQLDRRDFPDRTEQWLIAVFTSATCNTCRDIVDKAVVMASSSVGVQEVEFTANRELHTRYGIDSVPALVLADADGVVRTSFLGPVTATDLWAKVAEARGTAAG